MAKYCVFQKQEGLEGEDKCGEGGVGAVEADGAGVGTHDLAGEGEADAGAFGAGGEEGVEDVVGVLIGNGVSVVGDGR